MSCTNVGGPGVWVLQRGGAEYPLPSSPRVQRWGCGRAVLAAPVQRRSDGRGRLFLRVDSSTLGCTLRQGTYSHSFMSSVYNSHLDTECTKMRTRLCVTLLNKMHCIASFINHAS